MGQEHTHYLDYLDLRGDGRVVLYKRADHQSPKWTVRLKIPNVKGFIVKSAKTADAFEARRFAEDLYYELEGRSRRGEPIKTPTFRRVFESWSKSVSDDETKDAKFFAANVRRLEIWALPYLGDDRIDIVNEDRLHDYYQWRVAKAGTLPTGSTLRNERTAFNHFFRFAKRKGLIRDVPEIRLRGTRPNPRPDIPDAEWAVLCRFLEGHVDSTFGQRRRHRLYLQQYILILANTGLRVGEARRLKWRDISTTKTLTGDVRLVFTVRGKTGEREVVCNVGVDRCLATLRSNRLRELGGDPPSDEFVFCHADGKMIASFKGSFERALKKAGVLYGSDGKKRVPYSLRHTYATMRISEGVGVFQLAANMGTSVEMIEDFYGKKRMRDPKMATEVTKTALIAILG